MKVLQLAIFYVKYANVEDFWRAMQLVLLNSTGFTQMTLMLIMVSTGQLVILLNCVTPANMASCCHLIR